VLPNGEKHKPREPLSVGTTGHIIRIGMGKADNMPRISNAGILCAGPSRAKPLQIVWLACSGIDAGNRSTACQFSSAPLGFSSHSRRPMDAAAFMVSVTELLTAMGVGAGQNRRE
jgi:hypothetical protein